MFQEYHFPVLPAVIVFCAFLGTVPAAYGQDIRVEALGGVNRPGTYTLPNGSRFSSLIERAGGYADNAWLPGAVLTRKSLIRARKATVRNLIAEVEAEAIAAGGDQGAIREYLVSLFLIEPSGKTKLRLPHIRLLKGSELDLLLEDGDTLDIPTEKPPVNVAGAVRNPCRLPPAPQGKDDYKAYIRNAGGFTEDADRDGVYLLKGDATAVVLSRKWIRWNPERARWEFSAFGGNSMRIEPGDTIVVPRKRSPRSWASGVKNLPDLLMRISAIAGTVVEAP